jgi:hypothetical protein
MDDVEILRRARKRLRRPESWTRGSFARDVHGEPAYVNSDEAISWCAIGAVRAEVDRQSLTTSVVEHLEASLPAGDNILAWNDDRARTHTEVIRLFDRAIRRAQRHRLSKVSP